MKRLKFMETILNSFSKTKKTSNYKNYNIILVLFIYNFINLIIYNVFVVKWLFKSVNLKDFLQQRHYK